MSASAGSTVVLRALEGRPLDDETIRRTVIAAAEAIAERNGVELRSLEAEGDRVVATLDTGRLAAVGFAAELRRITTAWHRGRTGAEHLWGEPRAEPEEDDPYGLFGDEPGDVQ